jgi:tetratricopeptide (TPR) repeat protein
MPRALATVLRMTIASAVIATPTSAVAGDWDVQRDPFDRGVIARYKAILAKSPHDASALAQMVSLYRRYRTVEKLANEYRSAPETWSSLVVLALIERKLGANAEARARLERAVVLHDRDAATWRVLAQLREHAGDRVGARIAYEQAYARTSGARDAQALRDLIAFAQKSSDHEREERYFSQLVVVLPRDARVWTERGDAMLNAGRFELARESYATAERLLSTSPEARISVIVRGARALQKLGKSADAMRELHRALAMVPRGSYAVRELVLQIVQTRREANALPQAIAELEAMWPEKARKHFEWSTLASLYEETGDLQRAVAALTAAVSRSPTETTTQLRLIELLDRTNDTQQALVRMEAVARAQPRDVALQLSLARRYGWLDARAFQTLVGLAKRASKDRETLMAIVELYLEWDRDDLAETELANVVSLAESSKDPGALAEIGARALELGTYKAALAAYLAATKLAPDNPTLWAGLASAHDGLRNWDEAFEAAEMVLLLIPNNLAHRAARRAARKNLVQILLRTRMHGEDYVNAFHEMWSWSFEQDDDLESGYFLAAYYSASPRIDQPYATLARLHLLVPDDEDIAKELALARTLDRDALSIGSRRRVLLEHFPHDDRVASLDGPRIGLHVGVGPGIRDMPLSFAIGTRLSTRIARHLTLDTRIDWTRRIGDLGSTNAMGASAGLAAHVFTTRQVALLVGAAQRVEVRFGGELMHTGWNRVEAGNDFTTSLVLRDAPFVVGTRVEALYSGRINALLELGFEWR